MTNGNPWPSEDELAKDGFTEIDFADIDRIDLVSGAANGHRFLLAKGSDPNLLDADTVRELAKREEEEMTDTAPAAPVESEPVTKADDAPIDVADIIADAPSGGTADSVPGSPDWEIRDADTATTAIGVLARVRAALDWLQGREAQELASDAGANPAELWHVEDAAGALDYAVEQLAPYASGEKVDAELTQEAADAITKVAQIDPTVIETVEQYGPIRKAGRVLSAKNETLLREAGERLNTVLSALPTAPESVEKKETIVTDENPTPEAEPVEKSTVTTTLLDGSVVELDPAAAELAKAEKMQAVFDQEGKLVGVVKPSQLIPIEGGGAPSQPEADEPTADDLDPAPASEVGVDPDGEPVTKSDESADIAKMSDEELVKAANDGEDPTAQRLAALVKSQQDEIELLKSLPAEGGPIANGAPMPEARNLRGQDNGSGGASVVSAERVTELKKASIEAGTPAEREAARLELNQLAISALGKMRDAGPTLAPTLG